MDMRKAQVENGIVTNVILVDPDNVPEWCANWPDATDDAEVGGSYVDGVFTRPPAPEPSIPPVPQSITFAQLLIGLVSEQWISEADGEGWLAGVLPSAVLATINLLPKEQQFAAKARASRPSEVLRADPLVAMMAMAQGRTDAEIDDFFRKYAGV